MASPLKAAVQRLEREMSRGWVAAGLVFVVGALLGVVTLVGQGHLSDRWAGIANSGAVWLVAATLLGAVMPTDLRAALAGAGTLVVAVIVFYASVPVIVSGASSAPRAVVIWSVVALAAGPVFGVAGRWMRSDQTRRRVPAAVLIGGSFLAEGIARWRTPPSDDRVLAIAMIAVALLVPIVIGRSLRERVLGILGQPVVLLVTLAAYLAINTAFLRW